MISIMFLGDVIGNATTLKNEATNDGNGRYFMCSKSAYPKYDAHIRIKS